MIELILPSTPVPWSASRITARGAFNPRSAEKKFTQWQVKSLYRGEMIQGYVVLEFKFFMPIPNSTSLANKKRMLNGEILPTASDCTNLQKFAEDCLKGIVFSDDRNVARISSEKLYAEKGKILIKVWTYDEYQLKGLI